MGTPARRLQALVAGCLGDQIMGHSRDVHRTLVKMFFKFNSKTHYTYFDSLLNYNEWQWQKIQ